ncbi:hypothetical protein P8C59_008561 [Phyllachora maydis]|uniref:Uncharacterized protein n=1 Tax=Phyllachora maydis TaxID=1825666 RepID=A0AAD9ICG0_9PEZI|nr:hypothetical protein P8C59_008561 [Phyllachora maydis]
MHAPSLTPVLTAGLVATSAVSCFQLDTGCGLVVRHVATLMLAVPALALPAIGVDVRDPHHQKDKSRGGNENARNSEKVVDLEAREPHHQEAKGKGKGGNENARNGEKVANLEAREPHHQKAKGKGKGN